MTVRMNGEVLVPGRVVEVDQVPPQFRVNDEGLGITFEWPENPDYLPQEHFVAKGANGTLQVNVTLFDRETQSEREVTVEIDGN